MTLCTEMNSVNRHLQLTTFLGPQWLSGQHDVPMNHKV